MAYSFAVMRHPTLMEDEGRVEFVRTFETKEEAQAWINKQDEYFKPSDYYILEATGEHRE